MKLSQIEQELDRARQQVKIFSNCTVVKAYSYYTYEFINIKLYIGVSLPRMGKNNHLYFPTVLVVTKLTRH